MLEKWQIRLAVINLAVFITVLAIFCAVVYHFGCMGLDSQLKDKVRSIADSAISSIDFDDYGESHNGKPDLIVSILPDEASPALQPMRIQWFNTQGKLDIEKGVFHLNVPLQLQECFQWQTEPPALVFTKPAIADKRLLGYVRVGHPLAEIQLQKLTLLECLVFGTLAAVTASGVGIFFLVKQALRPVEEVIERLQQFCADAAHELRTPITAIRTNAEVALRHPENMRSTDKAKFEAVASGALQIEKLTEDLLILARAEQLSEGRQDSVESPEIDVAEHVKAAFEKIFTSASRKEVRLESSVATNLILSIDEDDFDCIMRNLLDNAIKYTPQNGSISVVAVERNGGCRITVTDSGIGISKEDLPKVFDRFWRADQARSYDSGGNGLGLSIVKALVEKYDGSINVDSIPGKQTEFKIDFRTLRPPADGRKH